MFGYMNYAIRGEFLAFDLSICGDSTAYLKGWVLHNIQLT